MDESLVKIRHSRSQKDFPGLKLEEDEYVEFFFRRAKIAFTMIWVVAVAGLIFILLGFLLVLIGQSQLDDMGRNFLSIILFSLLAANFLFLLLALKIYYGNKLYITNKRAIQMVMNSPVSTSINVIDLFSVEDASFRQENLWQKLFRYGTLRLATVGEETTYTFKYSDIKPAELRAVTDLISDAKEKTVVRKARK
ncbi:PH domain-containing protein [Candidatus Saccharibacteria bacterium]|nr:PH domain-containing protein [Candidatus Saccharibacteria bacterium]